MSKGKQIDDLRDFLERVNGKDGISILGTVPLAEALYEAGYRKCDTGKRTDETELKKALLLLSKAIEQVTVNTYAEQGQAGADEVFRILEQVENICAEQEGRQ